MCGIFAYVGTRSAAPILLEGLQTLEYRGYDSAGMYLPGHGVIRAVGPIAHLAERVPETVLGTCGIAHTRWATHGPPTEANAHPHHDGGEALWIVHNGIIDNWREIKDGLLQQGHTFTSDTDTEVLAKLLGSNYRGNVRDAIRTTIPYLQGTFGLAVVHEDHPEEIHVARLGSPIVIGLGTDGNLVSSDPSALLAHTKDVVYLEDGDVALVTATSYDIVSAHNGADSTKTPERIEWDMESVQKQGFPHFMLKEICEAPEVIENTIRGRLMVEKGRVKLGGLESVLPRLNQTNQFDIVGCGSAYYAGAATAYILEAYGGMRTSVELASEYRHRTRISTPHTAVVAISQSGETADTLAAIKKARQNDLLTLGIINVVGSSIPRETHAGVYNHAGPEIAVASTKAFISQLAVGTMVTVLLGRERNMTQATGTDILKELAGLPDILRSMLVDTTSIETAATWLAQYNNALFIGRNTHMAIAAEGALKMKEVSYMHAESYAGGELKHGPLALLDENMPVVALVPNDHTFEKMCSNLEEIKARKAPILAITTDNAPNMHDIADHVLTIPAAHPAIQPTLTTVPLHLLAYYVGVNRGFNVDRPRNLAKSVTVE